MTAAASSFGSNLSTFLQPETPTPSPKFRQFMSLSSETPSECAIDEAAAASNEEDFALMDRIARGDDHAFQLLVEKHQYAVIGTVSKMLGGAADAEDIAQQVFLRIWKSAPRFEPKAKFTTWMFTITRNLVFNESRRRKRKPTVSVEQQEEEAFLQIEDSSAPGADEMAQKSELWQAIDDAIAALPEKQRMAVILRQHEDMSYEDIAKVLKTSVSAVKSHLFRARVQLKDALSTFLAQA